MSGTAPILGIDLGTTNSLVAVAGWGDHPGPRVIPDEHGRMLLPSVVRFNDDGTTTIGHEAREQAVLFPLTSISSVKRLMGRSLRDAAADLPYLSFRVVEGPHATARVEIPDPAAAPGEARTISPQEVSSLILRELKQRASRALGLECTRAVVTVPAYFDDAQRQATRDAGRLAGLDVVRIVNEPTAAALAYGIGLAGRRTPPPQTIVVFDLGGGTFDVSVLRLTPGEEAGSTDFFQVLSTAGDTHLGGDDLDHALVGLFTREISERFFGGAELDLPPATRQALVRFAEQAKIRLSEAEEARVRIDLGETGGGAEHEPSPRPPPSGRGSRVYERTVTRAEFESLATPLVDRAIECCTRALRDAARHMEGDAIGAVVMVGGATRTPLVRRRVAEVFGIAPYTALDPDLVVALGAAVQGAVLAGSGAKQEGKPAHRPTSSGRGSLLLDVVPLSLGIETVGGAMAKLVMRNSTVPTRAHEMFSTSVDGQTSIKLHVLQGEREMAADCRSLGEFHLRGIPPMPAGIPKLRVEFSVDANGILSVSAAEERSGKRLDVQIVPNHGLTREEVERIERESITHARDDMTRHRIVDLAANSKLDVRWIEKTLERVGTVQGAADSAYLEQLRAMIADLRVQIERAERDWRSVDADEFHAAKERLDKASVRLHEIAIAMSLRGSGT